MMKKIPITAANRASHFKCLRSVGSLALIATGTNMIIDPNAAPQARLAIMAGVLVNAPLFPCAIWVANEEFPVIAENITPNKIKDTLKI